MTAGGGAGAPALAAVAPALATATAPGWSQRVPVSAPFHPAPSAPGLALALHPHAAVPHRGYYYAVAVLEHFRHLAGGPGCAVSSNMERTQYGRPGRDGRVHLELLPAPSVARRWCAGGIYEGAVYAVPHPPPCTHAYPCFGRSSCGPDGGVCGLVPRPIYEYSYPNGLPKPLDARTRIVGRFTIHIGPTV